jgi:hypothetical protein
VFQPNPTLINIAAFVSDLSKAGTHHPDQKSVKDVSQEELLQSFEDFEDEAQQMFKVVLLHTIILQWLANMEWFIS